MANVHKNRLLPTGGVVYDFVDLYQLDGYTRVVGVTIVDLILTGFFNGALLAWPLISGVGVTDTNVVSGNIYWSEVEPGRYLVRWRATSPGSWSWSFRYDTVPQEVVLGYDFVSSLTPTPPPGLYPRFTP